MESEPFSFWGNEIQQQHKTLYNTESQFNYVCVWCMAWVQAYSYCVVDNLKLLLYKNGFQFYYDLKLTSTSMEFFFRNFIFQTFTQLKLQCFLFRFRMYSKMETAFLCFIQRHFMID